MGTIGSAAASPPGPLVSNLDPVTYETRFGVPASGYVQNPAAVSGTLPVVLNGLVALLMVSVLFGSALRFARVAGVAPFNEPSPMAVPWLIVTSMAETPAPIVVTNACAGAEPPSPASGALPASPLAVSHWIVMVRVLTVGSQAPPSTTGPSPTVNVKATGPGAVHVKFVA